jgi:peptidoglycan/LPS O-acetylase OafA/YrhL
MSERPVHYRALDVYRFAAALAVAYFHFSSLAGLPANPNLRHAVDFFFILSGFVMYHTYRELRAADVGVFLVRRLARIYPLHLATLAFFFVYGLLKVRLGAPPAPMYETSAIVPNLLMIHAWGTTTHNTFNGPSWSISAEWFVYLLFPVFLALGNWISTRRPGVVFLLLGLLALLALIAFEEIAGGRSWTLWTYDMGALRAIPSFLFGMAIRALPLPPVRWLVVYAALLLYAGLYMLSLAGEWFVLSSMAVIALTAAAQGASLLASSRLKFLADASYAMYMVHLCIGTILFGMARNQPGRFEPHVLIASALILTLIVSLASFALFEKPSRDLLRKWLEPLVRPQRDRPGSP